MISIGCPSELHAWMQSLFHVCCVGLANPSRQVIRDMIDFVNRFMHEGATASRFESGFSCVRHGIRTKLWAFIGFSHFSEAAESSLRKLNEFTKVKASLITELKSRVDRKSIHGCLRSIPRDFDLLENPSEEK